MSAGISYSPESMTYTLFDGTNSLKLPNWAHRVMHEEFEREVRPLNDKIEILSDALALAREENAKFRELAGYMLRCMLENHDCSDCLINGEHCEISYIEEDLSELGIEVLDG